MEEKMPKPKQLCWKTMDWNDVLWLSRGGGGGGENENENENGGENENDCGKNEENKRDNELIVA